MSLIKPGGALLQLPHELQDEIYSYCLHKSYRVFWFYHRSQDYYNRFPVADLALLRVSQAISATTKHTIFSKATTFIYDIDFNPSRAFTRTPTKDVTDRMTNVKFRICIDPTYRFDDTSLDRVCEATVDRFVGTTAIRDSFRVQFNFHGSYMRRDFGKVMRTRFFQTLRNFNGFRLVVVVLQWRIGSGQDENAETQKEAKAVQMELEPSLGPSVIKKVKQKVLHGIYLTDTKLELEFHPLKFHVDNLRSEAARLTKEADMLEA